MFKISIIRTIQQEVSKIDPLSITKPGEKLKTANIKTPSGKLMNMTASVVCSGGYNAVLGFINNIETDKRIAEVQTVSISSQGDDKLQVSLNINYYYLDKGDKPEIKGYDFLQNSSKYGKSNMFNK